LVGPLTGIRWQLTASYALVVVAAAASLTIVATGLAIAKGSAAVGRTAVQPLLQKDAAAAARFLATGSAPAGALHFWAVIPTVDDLAIHTRHALAVAILDSKGRVVVDDSCTRASYETESLASCHSAAASLLRPVLADAGARRLLKDTTRGFPVSGEAAGHGFVAAPILTRGKQAQGALLAVFEGAAPSTRTQWPFARVWSQWNATLPHDWLLLIGFTILLGTVVGALFSHRLVHRVQRIAAVARVWSRGDLTPTADASRRDELGTLAADLNQMAEQIRNLLDTRSEVATQEERRRVQRDLHDGIKQELFAASMQLAAARSSLPAGATAIGATLDQAQASCLRAQQELVALLDAVPPSPLSGASLEAALSELGDRVAGEANLEVTQEISAGIRLSEAAEAVIFRIAQEALNNIRRHAGATNVTLTLSGDVLEARLRIHDDGRGFNPDALSIGIGIRTMRERVEALDGHLTVESDSTGTTLNAVIPQSLE
jgi:signal transduction histidine kinase